MPWGESFGSRQKIDLGDGVLPVQEPRVEPWRTVAEIAARHLADVVRAFIRSEATRKSLEQALANFDEVTK
jgi:hypothetical protein